LIKEFSILVSVMIVLTGFISLHYVTHHGTKQKEMLNNVAKVTAFSSPSLSAAYYEPRVLFFEDAANPAYPQMQTINKMDLVYAQ